MIDSSFTLDTGKQFLIQRTLNDSAVGNWMASSGATTTVPDVFHAGPSAGQIWRVKAISIYVLCLSTRTADLGYFWRNGAALTNGILFRKQRNGALDHYLIADPITTAFEMNMCFAQMLSKEFPPTPPWADGAQEITYIWTAKAAGYDLYLDGDKGEKVAWVIQDTMPGVGQGGNTLYYDLVKG